jgi:hypothetical protein
MAPVNLNTRKIRNSTPVKEMPTTDELESFIMLELKKEWRGTCSTPLSQ